jgi:hypothetical protein
LFSTPAFVSHILKSQMSTIYIYTYNVTDFLNKLNITVEFRSAERYLKREVLLKINRKNYIQQNNNFTYTLLYNHTNN